MVVALAGSLAACSSGSSGGDDNSSSSGSDPGPPWWQPRYGQVKNWDIQLSAPIDTSAVRTMYDLDLWSLVPADTTIDYGDGDPVAVPRGALFGTIAQLHARTPSTIVICHVETGALEMARPDARKFPKPTDLAVPGLTNAFFLDTSAAGRAAWAPIMFKRFDLARQIGCDGIEPAHNDAIIDVTAMNYNPLDLYSWYTEVATQGHARKLSTGMRGGERLPTTYDEEADDFDWVIIERCGEDGSCDQPRTFFNLDKPVLALEYTTSEDDPPVEQDPEAICLQQGDLISEGLVKDVALTSKFWRQCEP